MRAIGAAVDREFAVANRFDLDALARRDMQATGRFIEQGAPLELPRLVARGELGAALHQQPGGFMLCFDPGRFAGRQLQHGEGQARGLARILEAGDLGQSESEALAMLGHMQRHGAVLFSRQARESLFAVVDGIERGRRSCSDNEIRLISSKSDQI